MKQTTSTQFFEIVREMSIEDHLNSMPVIDLKNQRMVVSIYSIDVMVDIRFKNDKKFTGYSHYEIKPIHKWREQDFKELKDRVNDIVNPSNKDDNDKNSRTLMRNIYNEAWDIVNDNFKCFSYIGLDDDDNLKAYTDFRYPRWIAEKEKIHESRLYDIDTVYVPIPVRHLSSLLYIYLPLNASIYIPDLMTPTVYKQLFKEPAIDNALYYLDHDYVIGSYQIGKTIINTERTLRIISSLIKRRTTINISDLCLMGGCLKGLKLEDVSKLVTECFESTNYIQALKFLISSSNHSHNVLTVFTRESAYEFLPMIYKFGQIAREEYDMCQYRMDDLNAGNENNLIYYHKKTEIMNMNRRDLMMKCIDAKENYERIATKIVNIRVELARDLCVRLNIGSSDARFRDFIYVDPKDLNHPRGVNKYLEVLNAPRKIVKSTLTNGGYMTKPEGDTVYLISAHETIRLLSGNIKIKYKIEPPIYTATEILGWMNTHMPALSRQYTFSNINNLINQCLNDAQRVVFINAIDNYRNSLINDLEKQMSQILIEVKEKTVKTRKEDRLINNMLDSDNAQEIINSINELGGSIRSQNPNSTTDKTFKMVFNLQQLKKLDERLDEIFSILRRSRDIGPVIRALDTLVKLIIRSEQSNFEMIYNLSKLVIQEQLLSEQLLKDNGVIADIQTGLMNEISKDYTTDGKKSKTDPVYKIMDKIGRENNLYVRQDLIEELFNIVKSSKPGLLNLSRTLFNIGLNNDDVEKRMTMLFNQHYIELSNSPLQTPKTPGDNSQFPSVRYSPDVIDQALKVNASEQRKKENDQRIKSLIRPYATKVIASMMSGEKLIEATDVDEKELERLMRSTNFNISQNPMSIILATENVSNDLFDGPFINLMSGYIYGMDNRGTEIGSQIHKSYLEKLKNFMKSFMDKQESIVTGNKTHKLIDRIKLAIQLHRRAKEFMSNLQ